MSETTIFPLTIDLGGQNGEMQFGSLDHLRTWLGTESTWRQRWEDGYGTYSQLNEIKSKVGSLLTVPLPGNAINDAVAEGFREIPTSGSLDGQFIEQLSARYKNRPEITRFAWAILTARARTPRSDYEWQAAWIVARRNRVTDGTVQATASKLSAELLDLQVKKDTWIRDSADAAGRAASTATALNEQLQQIEVLRERSKSELTDEISKGIAEHKETYQQAAAAAASTSETLTNDLKKRSDEIAAVYRTHMALKAPVTYWEAKRRVHRAKARLAMSAFFWSLAVAAVALPLFSWLMLPSESEWPKFPVARIGIVAILVTLAFWGLRIIARLMLSHLHLTNDAAERTVMVKSYLALRTEGALSDGKGEEAILKALFRTAGTGIAKEDANPRPFFVEIAKSN